MNYEQKYKKVLEQAQQAIENIPDKPLVSWLENIFPELRESEDERIRKGLIENFSNMAMFSNWGAINKIQVSDIIAWLEKQGEKKTEIEYIYPKFRIGDVIEPIKPNGFYPPVRVLSIEKKTKSYYCESDDHKHYSSIPIRCENEYKLVEQKPAWGEEDNIRLDHLIGLIQKYGLEYYASIDKVIDFIDWLKSLKPQNKWRPSEKQMSVLQIVIKYGFCAEKNVNVLESLYQDLKKLM